MSKEVKEILVKDKSFIDKVIDHGKIVWRKEDPNDDERFTIKFLYNGKEYKFFSDNGVYSMKELENSLPDLTGVT